MTTDPIFSESIELCLTLNSRASRQFIINGGERSYHEVANMFFCLDIIDDREDDGEDISLSRLREGSKRDIIWKLSFREHFDSEGQMRLQLKYSGDTDRIAKDLVILKMYLL